MRCVVDSAIRIPKSERRPNVDYQIFQQLRFPNPDFETRVRFGRNTEGIPEHIELVETDAEGALVLPRGAASIVKRAAEECGELVRFEDRRLVCASVLYTLRYALRDYQLEAAEALARNVQASAVVACGGGKSPIVLGAIARVAQPTLIIVHTRGRGSGSSPASSLRERCASPTSRSPPSRASSRSMRSRSQRSPRALAASS
jgi:hypothetical protein